METLKTYHDLYLTFYCWQMFLEKLEIIAERIIDYAQVIIWAHQP